MTKEARIYNGDKIVFSANGVGKVGQLHINKVRTYLHITHNNLKWLKTMYKRLYFETPRREYRQNIN